MTEQSDEFELYLSEVENVNSLEELKLQLDRNEIDYGERYIGSHALYYKIWTQCSLIDALEQALADNKAWYLKISHDAIRRAEEQGVVQIENVRDYDLIVKQALTIQGDDKGDRSETNELLRGILDAIRQDSGSTIGRGVKRSFNDSSESESG